MKEGNVLATTALSRFWKNEYFQTIVSVALVVMIVFGFWFGVRAVLNTHYPALAVASGSMLPTLNVGDLIIVQGTTPSQINASYMTGDIIVFRRPYGSDELIVHRAVKSEKVGDVYYFTTRGDHNGADDPWGRFDESLLVGKVVGRVPWVGNFSLFTQSLGDSYLLVVLIIIIVVIILSFPFTSEDEDKPHQERKLFGKVTIRMIYVLVLNGLLISIAVFGLAGALTFSKDETIRGMYPDIQFHESFSNIHRVFLSQGFLTYTINCNATDVVYEGIRLGVATFSWAQAAIFALLVLDVWELLRFMRKRKRDAGHNEGLKPI
jgi:signal peptidase